MYVHRTVYRATFAVDARLQLTDTLLIDWELHFGGGGVAGTAFSVENVALHDHDQDQQERMRERA